jgi:hypothetical protein
VNTVGRQRELPDCQRRIDNPPVAARWSLTRLAVPYGRATAFHQFHTDIARALVELKMTRGPYRRLVLAGTAHV